MNKVLPNHAKWLVPTPHVHARRQEDFADTLHARLRQESGRSRANHSEALGDPGTAGSTTTAGPVKNAGSSSIKNFVPGKPEKSAMPATAGRSLLEPDSGLDPDLESAPDVTLIYKEASTSSTGLLSGLLAWSRVYPEHLLASGYLSLVDTAARDGGAPAGQVHLVVSGADIRGSNFDAAVAGSDLLLTKAAAAVFSVASGGRDASARWTTVSGLDPERVSSSRDSDAAMSAERFWAERLMRLTQGSDGRATVWLRDYGLKESEFEHVAAALKQRGRQEGLLIGRVVINGHEIWCAATSEGEH